MPERLGTDSPELVGTFQETLPCWEEDVEERPDEAFFSTDRVDPHRVRE